jgi:3-hydroxybutyryl-CoA dehydrogenase
MINSLTDIKKFLVLGGGTLGSRVALQAALSGFNVTVYDIDDIALTAVRETQQKLLNYLVSEGRISFDAVKQAQDRIHFTTQAEEAAADADFINESVTENPEIKKEVWREFSRLCPEKTLFTSNSSYMVPSMLLDGVDRPSKYCHFHFHDVFFANVVDIMPHPGTDTAMIELLKAIALRLNQIPVVVKKENPGYIFNTMLSAILGAAGQLVIHGVSSVEDVDRSWMGNFKMNIGPFGMMDEIGLETVWHVTSNRSDKQSRQFAAFIKPYIDEGKLGVKTGRGFYQYPNPAYKKDTFLTGN